MRWLLGAALVLAALVALIIFGGRFLAAPPVATPQSGIAIEGGLAFEGAALSAAIAEAGLEAEPLETGPLRIIVPGGRGAPSPADRGVWIALSETAALGGPAFQAEILLTNASNVAAAAISLQGGGAIQWAQGPLAQDGRVAVDGVAAPDIGTPERLGLFLIGADPTAPVSADILRVTVVAQTATSADAALAPATAADGAPALPAEVAPADAALPPASDPAAAPPLEPTNPFDASLEDL